MEKSYKIRCCYIAAALIVAEIGTDLLMITDRALWDDIRVVFIIINAIIMAFLLQIHDRDDDPTPQTDNNYKVSTTVKPASI